MRPVVVLPQPDSPTSDSVSPRMTSNVRPSTAWTAPTWRWSRPRLIGKCLVRPSTWSRASPASLAAVGLTWVVVTMGLLC